MFTVKLPFSYIFASLVSATSKIILHLTAWLLHSGENKVLVLSVIFKLIVILKILTQTDFYVVNELCVKYCHLNCQHMSEIDNIHILYARHT